MNRYYTDALALSLLGMAWNKLSVFHLTQFRKLIWVDSDTIVFHNIDHLLLQPSFTAAYTQECNQADSYSKVGGSMWVVEPSWDIFNELEQLFSRPVPNTDPPEPWKFGKCLFGCGL